MTDLKRPPSLPRLTTHQLNPPVEKPVLPDGHEACNLPGDLEKSFAGDNSVIMKESGSGSSMHFNVFPTITDLSGLL